MKKPEKFKFQTAIKVNWGDMDAFGHVNNVIFLRYFETARAEYFSYHRIWENSGRNPSDGMVMSHIELDYRKQILYPEIITVYVGLESVQSRKFTVACSFYNSENECAASGFGEFIWFDFVNGKMTSVPEKIFQIFKEENSANPV